MVYDHKLPEVLEPVGDICVPLFIPAHKDYVSLLLGAIRRLTYDIHWERDNNYSAVTVREVWLQRTLLPLVDALMLDSDCGFGSFPSENNCFTYPSYAPFVSYYPQNPFNEPSLIPQGYLTTPFTKFSDFNVIGWLSQWLPTFTESLTGYQPNDIIVDLGAIPLFANWETLLNGAMPQITVTVEGEGVAELHLLAYPLGGRAIITVDSQPNIADIYLGILGNGQSVELERDLLSLPIESDSTVIEEVEITGVGTHNIYITFLPVVDDSIVPIKFGGGFRGVQLCGFDSAGVIMGITDIRVNGCEIEKFVDGSWLPITGSMMDCINSAIAPVQAQVTANANNISSNDTDITNLQNANQSLQNQITTINNLVNTHENEITVLQVEMNQLLTIDIPQHNLTIQDHETRITTLENAPASGGGSGGGVDIITSGYSIINNTNYSSQNATYDNIPPLNVSHKFTYNKALIIAHLPLNNTVVNEAAYAVAWVNGVYGVLENRVRNTTAQTIIVSETFYNIDTTQAIEVGIAIKTSAAGTARIPQYLPVNYTIIEYGTAIVPIEIVTFDAGGMAYNLTGGQIGTIQAGGNPDNCLRADNAVQNEYVEVIFNNNTGLQIADIQFDTYTSLSITARVTVYVDNVIVGTEDVLTDSGNAWNSQSWAGKYPSSFPLSGTEIRVRVLNPISSPHTLRLDNLKFITV